MSIKEVIGDESVDMKSSKAVKKKIVVSLVYVYTEQIPSSSDILTHLPSFCNQKMWLDKKRSYL